MINALAQKNVSGYYYDPEDGDNPDNFTVSGEEDMGYIPLCWLEDDFLTLVF